MLSGSSSQIPGLPALADASTVPVEIDRPFLPEVSTNPPSPPAAPPRACIEPLNEVAPSAHTITVPPLPVSMALAVTRAFGPTTVWLAVATPPPPCSAPPTSTVPPPAAPDASIEALPNKPTRSPSTFTVPPVWPAPAPETSMLPLTTVSPPIARSVTMPLCSDTLLARITPVWLTAVARAPSRVLAISATAPPSAWMLPALATLARSAPSSTEKLTRRSPATSTRTREPANRATEPPSALIAPLLMTCGAASTTKLPGATLMRPSLRTSPPALPPSR